MVRTLRPAASATLAFGVPWTQMLRVYLDQNKWVDLSRGLGSEDDGAKFHDMAFAVGAAVEAVKGQQESPLVAR